MKSLFLLMPFFAAMQLLAQNKELDEKNDLLTPTGTDGRVRYQVTMPEFEDSLKNDPAFIKGWREQQQRNLIFKEGISASSIHIVTGDTLLDPEMTEDQARQILLEQQKFFSIEIDQSEFESFDRALLITPDPMEERLRLIVPDDSEINLPLIYETPSQFDSRVEIAALNAANQESVIISQRAHDVFCVTERQYLEELDNGSYRLIYNRKLGDVYNLCATEPYVNQPSLCIGTAFLADGQHILSSLHVFSNHDLEDLVLIRSFRTTNLAGEINEIFDESDVYRLSSFVGQELDSYDIALVKLDRKVTANNGLSNFDIGSNQHIGDQVYTLGHPIGLPMKFTFQASIRSMNDYYFNTTLDTFQGNSGSPVYRRDRHQIIGILVGGGTDFELNGDCFISHLCLGSGCGQERVMRLSYIWPILRQYLKR